MQISYKEQKGQEACSEMGSVSRKAPEFSMKQHQVRVNVIFTLLCAVGLMGESQMLLLFSAFLGINPLLCLWEFCC